MSTSSPPQWTAESLQGRIDRSPFNRWLGLHLLDWSDGAIAFALRPRPETLGHAAINALHGGIIGAIVDAACSMAVVTRTGESVVTVDMRVDFLRPATSSEYAIRAQVLRCGRTLATADATVLDAEGKTVASGRALLRHVPDMARAGVRSVGRAEATPGV
jgi:uncharacterized protein (TIGR00369 family)